MARLTRRAFLTTASAIPFAVWFERYADAAPMVRYEARSPQGVTMLKTYAAAVKKMQATNDGNPLSWVFQWYTHCVKGSSSSAQQAPQKAAAIAAAYPPGTPAQKAVALAAWGTCQAHYSGLEDYFLPWHRMYVYFLERIVRTVSGVKTFTLPYWNYSVTGANHGVIPPQFRLPNDPVFKYLYVQKRNTTPNVNGGQAIDAFDPGALALTALNQCAYSNAGAVTGFCQTLDFGLHGNVHVDTGATQNMGAVPWAAGDPIFWMHHSNIDRLWASWNKAGRLNPSTPAFLTQTFTFADENGNGVTVPIKDFLSIDPLGYTYDRFEPVRPCPPRAAMLESAVRPAALLLSGKLELSDRAAHVELRPGPGPEAVVPKMSERHAQLKGGERIYLVLRNLETNAPAGVLYHVYLDLPDNTAPKAGNSYKAGVINFFHASGHGGHDAADGLFYSFDVTDLVGQLKAKGQLRDVPKVTIAPLGRPASEATPVVGEISLVQQ